MIKEFTDYQVEIKNKKFKSDSGTVFPKTAEVIFYFPGTSKTISQDFGCFGPGFLYDMIENKKEVNINGAYITELSFAAYRASRKMEPRSIIELDSFSAEDCLFDSSQVMDLNYIHFQGDTCSFEGSVVFRGGFSFANSFFKGKSFNFTNILFRSGDFDFANVKFGETEVLFKNTSFADGKKDFQYTDFGTGNKFFSNTDFGTGNVSFINTVFNDGNVFFKVARFGTGRVDFHFARFGKGDISFERAEFNDGDVDFRTVEFGDGRVNFNRCIIGNGDMSFEGCEQESGKFSFKRAKLGKGSLSFELAGMKEIELNFDKTTFGENSLSFYNGKFGSLSFQQCHLDNYTDLRVRNCYKIDLSNTIVRDIIDLTPYEFEEDIHIIDFGGMRLIGRIYINWHRNRVYQLIKNQEGTSNWIKAEQFRTLKENFNNCGNYQDEDIAYLQYKRHEARHALKTSLQRSRFSFIWAWPWHLIKLIIFDKAGHYATNPFRVIFTMITALTFFAFLYSILIVTGIGNIIESVDHINKLSAVGIGFYHSAITFFTIGYGDYYPEGIIRWISGLEGFSGMFLMSYFTVAFVRKILR